MQQSRVLRLICLFVARFVALLRVEMVAADWRSFLQSATAAAVFAAFGVMNLPELTSHLTALRFSVAALTIGIAMALQNRDGEAGAALAVGAGMRIAARLVSVGSLWVLATALIVTLSDTPSSVTYRLITESVVMATIAVFTASVGMRLWTTHYSNWVGLALSVGFLVSWLLPSEDSPWWNGIGPEPARYPWYLTGLLFGVVACLTLRRNSLLELPTNKGINFNFVRTGVDVRARRRHNGLRKARGDP